MLKILIFIESINCILMKTTRLLTFGYLIFTSLMGFAQPQDPVENWKGKRVLLIGAHPDDDHQSHGTLAMLNKMAMRSIS